MWRANENQMFRGETHHGNLIRQLTSFGTSFYKAKLYLRHSIVTFLLVTAAPISSFVYVKTCSSSCVTWLIGTASRSGLSFIVLSIAAFYVEEPRMLLALFDMIELIGMLWFLYGNLLFLTSSVCKSSCYYFGLAYIFWIHIFFFVPLLIRMCQRCGIGPPIPPPGQVVGTAEEHEIRRALEFTNRLAGARVINQQAKDMIESWLSSHECVPFKYHEMCSEKGEATCTNSKLFCPICLEMFYDGADATPEMPAQVDRVPFSPEAQEAQVERHENGASDENPGNSPSIGIDIHDVHCECDGWSSSSSAAVVVASAIVVTFPCKARHLFHLDCLTAWLQICLRERGDVESAMLTCPCCRSGADTT